METKNALAADNADDGTQQRDQEIEQTDQRRRVINNQGLSKVFIGLGVLLIVLGALFFVGQVVGFDLGRLGWPFFVIISGLAASGVGLAVGDPTGERVTPLGAAVTMTGVVLLYQNTANHFESWAYAWALVFPTSTGLGQMLYGSLKDRKEMRATGRRWAVVGIILFVLLAVFFEFIIGFGGRGIGLGGLGWPVVLIVLGAVLVVGRYVLNRLGR